MKKIMMMIFAFISVFVFSSSKVEATYNGKIGYEQSGNTYVFYYYTEREDAKVYLNIIKTVGTSQFELTDPEGDNVYIYIPTAGEVVVEDKYNYTVCDSDDTNCVTVIDPFSPYLSNDGLANIILDPTYLEVDWVDTANKNVTD